MVNLQQTFILRFTIYMIIVNEVCYDDFISKI